MNCNPSNSIAIVSRQDQQAIAQSELEQYLIEQAQAVAPEPQPQGKFTTASTIRYLKAQVSQLHKEMGLVISKALMGRRWSDLPKFFLVKALNFVQSVLDSVPRTFRWEEVQESRRITTSRADGKIWCTFFGCATEQEANRLYYWLLKKPGRCVMAAIRKGQRTNCPFEVKVWGVDDAVLAQAIRKDTPMLDLHDRMKAEGVSLRADASGGYFTVWVGRKIGVVVQKFDINQNSWWVNRRQITLNNCDDGDRVRYKTPEEAAIALAKTVRVIEEGERAKKDLFGG